MTRSKVRKLLQASLAVSAFLVASGVSFNEPTGTSKAWAKCGGPAFTGNPGNNKPVGNAGEHPPGGGGNSVTGDRGGSR